MIYLSIIALGFVAGLFTMTIIGLYKWIIQHINSGI